MEKLIIDDRITGLPEMVVTESKGGTRRTNGKTTIEMLREYKKKYGEEEYKKMLEETGIENPKCIKLHE